MNTLSILKIDFLDDHRIRIFLNDHSSILYDMNLKLKTTRFMELSDPNIFKQGSLIRNKIIRWSPCMEITLDEIILQNTKSISYKNQKKTP